MSRVGRAPLGRDEELLRSMQLKWHPDRQYGDESTKENAAELITMVNEAMRIAKANAKARGEKLTLWQQFKSGDLFNKSDLSDTYLTHVR